jgi:hypothetical protein
MPAPRHWLTDEQDQAEADRRTAGLAGFAFVLLLLVAGLFLVHTLYRKSRIEDCLMAGRLDCDRLVMKP